MNEENKHAGLRYDEGKLRMDLLHPVATAGLARVMTRGAEKYAPHNWEKGMQWTKVIACMKRHILAIERGEDFDPETGELHVDHVQANAHFLSAYYKIYPQGDDRPHNYLKDVRIGLDIDEVLCDWVGDWCRYRGKELPSNWYFDPEMVQEFERMKKEGSLDDFYLQLSPRISPNLPFEPTCYITSRPVSSEITEKWLSIHGFPSAPVFTTEPGRSKVDIAKEQNLDIFVDDAFHNFVDLNRAGICCFLMDAPHNRKYDVGFKRITNLNQIL